MPREGVPYPERLLCSLRCELKNIWNTLSGKLHSVNGVEGDGQGNITIISENAALTVNDYPLSNQIGLDLDPSQLPAADVNSVNGQTGAVTLTADDIPSDGSSDVQTDIDTLRAADVTLQGNITAEATARGNADSTLQTNINASNLRISNIENALSTDPDPDTIGLRDANGRLKAADPASGATDKTLVTANWISQTGNSAPNNVIHKTGNETKTGIFTCAETRVRAYYSTLHYAMPTDLASGTYVSIYKSIIPSGTTDRCILFMWNNTRKGISPQVSQCGFISAGGRPSSVNIANICGTVPSNHFAITRKTVSGTTTIQIWTTGQIKVFDVLFESIGLNTVPTFELDTTETTSDFSSYDEVKYL